MRAIVGLGNPGGRYQLTRHNVGFMFVDYLADRYGVSLSPSKSEFYAAEGNFEGDQFLLVKPTTFVNNSGSAISQMLQNYKIKTQDMLVVYDDLNLPLSDMRIRFGGSHGGHNGIYSLIYHLNTNQFPRLRLGIGSPHEKGKMAQFVLGKLTYEEFQALQEVFSTGDMLMQAFVKGGIKHMLDENSKIRDLQSLQGAQKTDENAASDAEQPETEKSEEEHSEEE